MAVEKNQGQSHPHGWPGRQPVDVGGWTHLMILQRGLEADEPQALPSRVAGRPVA